MKKILAYAILGLVGLTILGGMWYQIGVFGSLGVFAGVGALFWALNQI